MISLRVFNRASAYSTASFLFRFINLATFSTRVRDDRRAVQSTASNNFGQEKKQQQRRLIMMCTPANSKIGANESRSLFMHIFKLIVAFIAFGKLFNSLITNKQRFIDDAQISIPL